MPGVESLLVSGLEPLYKPVVDSVLSYPFGYWAQSQGEVQSRPDRSPRSETQAMIGSRAVIISRVSRCGFRPGLPTRMPVGALNATAVRATTHPTRLFDNMYLQALQPVLGDSRGSRHRRRREPRRSERRRHPRGAALGFSLPLRALRPLRRGFCLQPRAPTLSSLCGHCGRRVGKQPLRALKAGGCFHRRQTERC